MVEEDKRAAPALRSRLVAAPTGLDAAARGVHDPMRPEKRVQLRRYLCTASGANTRTVPAAQTNAQAVK
jgi:hypothetical protein